MADKRSFSGKLLIGLFVLLLVLAGAAVIGDRMARNTAQDRVATSLQEKFGTPDKPKVTMAGTPFLTQLLGDHYSQVDISATKVSKTTVPLETLDVKLEDVKANKNFSEAVAGKAVGNARVTWQEVGAKVNNLPIQFQDPDRVQATYTANVFGLPVEAFVTARPTLDAGAQTIVLTDPVIKIASIDLPADMANSLMTSLVQPIPVPLPASLKATAAKATADGMVIDFEGTDVDLTKL